MESLSWFVGILTVAFLASTKTSTAAKTTIKKHACKKGPLTLHYEADRNGNTVRDIDWKIKFPGTVWIKFFTCTNKPGLVCCKNQTVLADGFTLLNNSNCDYRTVTIERSRNATHDNAKIMYHVHYVDFSVSPSTREYQVKFTAQCVRIQEGRDVNLTKILLMNSLPCERVIDIEWYSINGSRFAHCNSCQLCTITPDSKHPVPVFWNRLQVTRGSLLLTGIPYNDNGQKLRVTAHLKIASDKPLVSRIWIFVDSGRESSGPNTTPPSLIVPTSRIVTRTSRSSLPSSSKSSYESDVLSTVGSTLSAATMLHFGTPTRSGASATCPLAQLSTAVVIVVTVYFRINQR